MKASNLSPDIKNEHTSSVKKKGFSISWEFIITVSMYFLCFVCLTSGILSLIYPESKILRILFPVFTFICIIEIIFNAISRIYNARIGKRKIQNAMEQAATAKEARNIFFANISHELRTPINIIQGMNEMIIRESNSQSISEYAKNVSIAGKNLERIVNNLIIYSRITTGYFSPIELQFDLLEYLTNYCNLLCKESKRNNFTFNHYTGTNIPRDTIGDNSLLGQLLDNLVSIPLQLYKNATVNLTFSWLEKENTYGVLSIHMDSPGIQIDEKALYSLNHDNLNTQINNSHGVDFNLTILKCIVDVLGGILDISNTSGNGTNFYIEIPCKVSAKQAISKHMSSQYNKFPSFTAPDARILVVDDHILNIEVILTLLKRTKIKIDSATNGDMAIDLLKENRYHLLLLDYMMPGMDGIKLFKRIKELFPEITDTTPVFCLSASTNAEIREKIISTGFKDFIPKPIDGKILEMIIKENLPGELIIENITGINNDIYTPQLINDFEQILLKYDIYLSEGMKYMSGDFEQYYTVASLISKRYEKTLNKVMDLFMKENYKDLGIAVHSLKGNARFIGATFMYNISMSIEKRCSGEPETEYIRLALPLLLYQWEKTIGGLRIFLNKADSMKLFKEEKATDEVFDSDYLERIMEYTDNFQPEPALKLIENILNHNLPSDQIRMLRNAAQCLEELEYDDAMNIFKEMIL